MLDGSGKPIVPGSPKITDPSAMARSGSITPAFKPVGVIEAPPTRTGPSPVTMSSSSYPGMAAKMSGPTPPADGGFWKPSYNIASAVETPDAGRLASVAGGLNTLKNFIVAPSLGTAATYAAPAYVAGRAATQLVGGISDAMQGRQNPITSASNETRQQTYDAIRAGDYGRAVGSGVRAMGQTAVAMGKDALSPFSSFIGGVFNSSPAASAPAATNSNPAPATLAAGVYPDMPVSTGNAATNAPSVSASPKAGLSAQYPSYFKSPPKLGDALGSAANNYKLPLTPEERLYNSEIQRGMELENRKRDMANQLAYRASQLGDDKAFMTLKALGGGPGESARPFAREEYNPEYRYRTGNSGEEKESARVEQISAARRAVESALQPNDDLEAGMNDAQKVKRRKLAAQLALGRYNDLLYAFGQKPEQTTVEDFLGLNQ